MKVLVWVAALAQAQAQEPIDAERPEQPEPREHREVPGDIEPAPPGAEGGDPSAAPAGEPRPPGGSGGNVGGNVTVTTRGPNFLMAVDDRSGLAAGRTLTALIDPDGKAASFELRDDGVPPDPIAGDSMSHNAIADYPAGPVLVRVMAGDEVLAETEVEIPADLVMPSLRVALSADGGADWQLASDAAVAASVAATAAATGGMTSSNSRPVSGLLAVGLLPGLALGGAAGWARWGRRRRRQQVAPTLTDAAGALPAGARIWQVPEALRREAVGAVAQRMRLSGPVLVVPLAASRPALARRLRGAVGVAWMAEERPTVARVQQALDQLSVAGAVRVVVEGVGALETPGPREPAYAVLEELLELVDALVICGPDDPLPAAPDRVLAAVPGGLGDGAGLVLALDEPLDEE